MNQGFIISPSQDPWRCEQVRTSCLSVCRQEKQASRHICRSDLIKVVFADNWPWVAMAAASPVAFSKLLDFSAPVDVELVESTVNIFYGAANQDQVGAEVAGGLCDSTPVICSGGCQHRTAILCLTLSKLVQSMLGVSCDSFATLFVVLCTQFRPSSGHLSSAAVLRCCCCMHPELFHHCLCAASGS